MRGAAAASLRNAPLGKDRKVFPRGAAAAPLRIGLFAKSRTMASFWGGAAATPLRNGCLDQDDGVFLRSYTSRFAFPDLRTTLYVYCYVSAF